MITKRITHIFISTLSDIMINYHYEGEWLVVDGNERGSVSLSYSGLSELPDKIEFRNNGHVNLYRNNLDSLPKNIKFNNNGNVDLTNNSLESLPDKIEFNNKGKVNLEINLDSLPDTIDTFYSKLDGITKRYISERFPDHWVVNKERFNL